ncbi:MAG: hypothetical protein H6739_00825 [Alphaproteobacteria bacterium]|nr:hypothetical protein [Alphaproteobacteria bacterium]
MIRAARLLPLLLVAACDGGLPSALGAGPGVDRILVRSSARHQLYLSNPTLDDQTGDGVWRPGEEADIEVTINESWGEEYWHFPGIKVTVEPDAVTWILNEDWLFGIRADDTHTFSFHGVLAEDVEPGAVLELTAVVTSMDCPEEECPAPNPLVFTVVTD